MGKYTIDDYLLDIDKHGLSKTWHSILSKIIDGSFVSDTFNVDNFGELYEVGLEHENKISKKEMGKYYTPKDVSILLSKWFDSLNGDNVCDVGCGTGNLILAYLSLLEQEQAHKLIADGKVYIYDKDKTALEICKYSIAIRYGKELLDKINAVCCDFLSKRVHLPSNAKVISNPPYYKITEFPSTWKLTNVIKESRELYSSFMEKIMNESISSVIITPYSFIGSEKFYSLREVMNKYNGFIVSFDNVPGNIFNGRKHGIFNTNKGNSVRAAITVVENKTGINGFRVSPLLRFKTEERQMLLDNKYLDSMISDKYQVVSNKNKSYYKCFENMSLLFETWNSKSTKKLKDLLTKDDKGRNIWFPTTCRYFTVGSKHELNRDGKRKLSIVDNKYYNYVYCLLNSSFAYWHWRLYDGGINYPQGLIESIPVFYDSMNNDELKRIDTIAEEMQKLEKKYLVYKINAGKKQENIKFPKKYRDMINKIFLKTLNMDAVDNIFDVIHSSSLLEHMEEDENE